MQNPLLLSSGDMTLTEMVGFCFSNLAMSEVCTGKGMPSKFKVSRYLV